MAFRSALVAGGSSKTRRASGQLYCNFDSVSKLVSPKHQRRRLRCEMKFVVSVYSLAHDTEIDYDSSKARDARQEADLEGQNGEH